MRQKIPCPYPFEHRRAALYFRIVTIIEYQQKRRRHGGTGLCMYHIVCIICRNLEDIDDGYVLVIVVEFGESQHVDYIASPDVHHVIPRIGIACENLCETYTHLVSIATL